MYEDSKGCYWVSVADGVGRLDPKTGKVMEMLSERHPELKTFRLVHALCPLGNDCFVAVGDNGLFYYDAEHDRVWIPDAKKDKFYKAGIKIFWFLKGCPWVGMVCYGRWNTGMESEECPFVSVDYSGRIAE